MDIHKPKPWHGVREFLKEYVIIVVGVLTALGAEQGVEMFHWSEKVRHSEVQLRKELAPLYFAGEERDRVETCLYLRLDQLRDALLAGQGDWRPLPPMTLLNRSVAVMTPSRNWTGEVWRSLMADGTASHLSPERELAYAGLYSQVATMAERNGRENDQVSGLDLLQNRLPLSNDKRADLIQRIAEERARVQAMAIGGRQLKRTIEALVQIDKAKIQQQMLVRSNTYRACYGLGLLPPGSPPPEALTPSQLQQLGAQAPNSPGEPKHGRP